MKSDDCESDYFSGRRVITWLMMRAYSLLAEGQYNTTTSCVMKSDDCETDYVSGQKGSCMTSLFPMKGDDSEITANDSDYFSSERAETGAI